MIIDVFQDTVCPWCRIGKKNLMDALKQWTGEPVTIRYRSYFLDPNVPPQGYPYRAFMESLFGNAQAAEQMFARVTEAGRHVGVTFRFDQIEYRPNTGASHNLIKLTPEEQVTDMVEAIYRAHFEEGKDIGNINVLADLAAAFGMDREDVKAQIEAGAKDEEIDVDIALAREYQISGVPFFVVNESIGLSGAHPAENFLKVFAEVSK